MKNFKLYVFSHIVASIIIVKILLVIAGCGSEDTSLSPKVVKIAPEPGTNITIRELFSIRFDIHIIPSSGSITYGEVVFEFQAMEAIDILKWDTCFKAPSASGPGPVLLTISGFQGINGEIQPEDFKAWYNLIPSDIGPPEIVEYNPKGQDIDPETTREIRVVFEHPIREITFTIMPPINGSVKIEKDEIQCIGAATWEFKNTDRLLYSTEYIIDLFYTDVLGNQKDEEFSFTTSEEP